MSLLRLKNLTDNKDIQEIKDEYNFDDIKNEFDKGKIPEILEFFYGGEDNEKFRINCEMLGKINELMKSLPFPPRLELSDNILKVLSDVEDVINDEFVKVEELDDKDMQEIKDEYNFDDIKNEFDKGKVPEILEFFYGGEDNEKFRMNCEMLGLAGDNSDFIEFLFSSKGEQIMQENSTSIHLKSGNLFHDNLNTRESFYDFLLNQQDENIVIIKKKISYYKTFKVYLRDFLQSFDHEEINKFDLFSDKKVKYLFYKFKVYLEATHQPKKNIRHTKKVNDKFSLEKM